MTTKLRLPEPSCAFNLSEFSTAVTLPGGGFVRELTSLPPPVFDTDAPTLHVLDQRHPDGSVYRWLCSISRHQQQLAAETVVRLAPVGRTTRQHTRKFDRAQLLPAYHRAMVAALGLRQDALCRAFLFVGVGGGALPLFLAKHHSHTVMTGVDPDARTLALAAEYFGCTRGPRLRLHALSAADFLQRCPRAKFDSIFVDATGSEGGVLQAPPSSLSSIRSLRGLRNRLRLGGALVINVLGGLTHTARVERALSAAFAPRDGVAWRIPTAEGNTVLVAVRRAADPTSAADRTAWVSACAAAGLSAEPIVR